MREAQYKRDLNHNFLVFPLETKGQDFRLEMLRHHQIKELLSCSMRRINHEMLVTFEVSEKQPLRKMFEKRPMNVSDIRKLIKAVSDVLEHMREYLLDMEMLVLDPDYIFCQEETGNFYFCCLPDEGESLFDSFRKLSAYFLQILDNRDQEAVRLGYSLYRNSLQDNFSLLGILEDGSEENGSAPEIEETVKSRAQIPGAVPEKNDIPEKKKVPAAEDLFPVQSCEASQKQDKKRKDPGNLQELDRGIAYGAGNLKEEGISGGQTEVYGYGMPEKPAKTAKKGSLRNGKKQASEKKSGLFGKSQHKKEPAQGRMAQLSLPLQSYAREKAFSYGAEGCILQSVKDPGLTFAPASFPFLMGSLDCGVDGFVDAPDVSHFHARLEKEEGVYSIMDLNSAHGTFVNGAQVPPESRRTLSFGDTFSLGSVTFRFLNKKNGN